MYLSRLDLQGFKSFADSTTLTFDPGVTAIVGPNGCGKSNIVDAVRWVIGEQRPTVLRSEKMENVIFNGTADRRPLGMAEVELTIQNNRGVLPTEYSEVTIGRRLFRDGKSEYLMNGTQCRLKDITDLFMDTGMGADAYSVIELKMIDEILSGSTEDRRRMFEEAAGITRYKMRRRQALRKLDSTQDDLDRIRDLTDEIRTQVERLRRQAEKAREYNEATEELGRLELLLAQHRYQQLAARAARLTGRRDEARERVAALQEKETEAEKTLQARREQLTEHEAELQERREALQAHRARVSDLEAEQRLQRERLERARENRARARETQQEAAEQRDALVDRVDRLESTLEQARPALEQAEEALEAARAERDAAQEEAESLRERARTLRKQVDEAEDEQAERRRTLDRLTNRRDLLREDRDRAQQRLEEVRADAEDIGAQIEEAEAERATAAGELEGARSALEDAEAERREREAALEEARNELRDLERRRDAAEAEVDLLEGLVSSYDEFSDAVQFLARRESEDLQTVADVLACDEDVRVALDAALGDLASCVVVETEADARAAIDRLRDAGEGQATFLVLDRLPEAGSLAPGPAPGPAEPLRAAVRTADPAYDEMADVLLHDCYLAGSLDDAQEAARTAGRGVRIFVPTGEWVDGRGVLKGGSRKTSASPVASRLGRREQLDRARSELERVRDACQAQEEAVETARQKLEAADVESRRRAVEEAEEALDRAETQLERVRYRQESVDDREEELQGRLEEIQEELDGMGERIATLREAVEQGEETVADLRQKRTEVDEALDDAEARERAAADAFSDANVEAVEARNRVENLERDLERATDRIDEIDRQSEARADEIEEMTQTIEEALDRQSELDRKIEGVRAEREERDEAVQEAEEALQETKERIDEAEARVRRLRTEREEAAETESDVAVRLAEVRTQAENLLEGVREDFERDLAEEPVDIPDGFDPDDAESRVKSLRGKVNAIGNVNPLALEEYEEEKERLDFLEEQKQDLEDAEETLHETIEEINSTAAERFFETYDEIKDSFSEIFTDLFGEGASARLQLEDPDDPLDSAIDIVAQPKGKRPVMLDQLSSGEKTLTAIALLFSIYLVKPSPFCILDEVDAPLDDANVERFMSLIRRFEDETQFVLVTHNQRTMALADRMYGITMEEQGVSKLVGVEFDEAVEMAG
jgi:chromosome segregation protein